MIYYIHEPNKPPKVIIPNNLLVIVFWDLKIIEVIFYVTAWYRNIMFVYYSSGIEFNSQNLTLENCIVLKQ